MKSVKECLPCWHSTCGRAKSRSSKLCTDRRRLLKRRTRRETGRSKENVWRHWRGRLCLWAPMASNALCLSDCFSRVQLLVVVSLKFWARSLPSNMHLNIDSFDIRTSSKASELTLATKWRRKRGRRTQPPKGKASRERESERRFGSHFGSSLCLPLTPPALWGAGCAPPRVVDVWLRAEA